FSIRRSEAFILPNNFYGRKKFIDLTDKIIYRRLQAGWVSVGMQRHSHHDLRNFFVVGIGFQKIEYFTRRNSIQAIGYDLQRVGNRYAYTLHSVINAHYSRHDAKIMNLPIFKATVFIIIPLKKQSPSAL